MAKKQVNIRLADREIAMLKNSAKAYRAPSLNWFVSELLTAMMNPDIWPDFQRRLLSGAEQMTLTLPAEKPRKKRRPA